LIFKEKSDFVHKIKEKIRKKPHARTENSSTVGNKREKEGQSAIQKQKLSTAFWSYAQFLERERGKTHFWFFEKGKL